MTFFFKTFVQLFIIILGATLITGCSVLSPVKTSSVNQYVINQSPTILAKKAYHRKILYITPTESTQLNNTLQMLYVVQRYRVNYFAKNEWVETPAQMFHPLLTDTMQKAQFFKIGTFGTLNTFDLMLNTRIILFQQEFMENASYFHIKVNAQLINGQSGRPQTTKTFDVKVPASPTPYGGVIAANEASARVLAQIARWTIEHGR